jgi:pilus assembly protein CpaF
VTTAVVTENNVMWSTRLYEGEPGTKDDSTVDEIVLLKRRIHEKLVEELDLKRQDISFLSNSNQLVELRQRTERVIANLLAKEIGGMVTSREVHARLVKEIADEALGLGPLEELLADPQVSDILVNNKDQIYVERHGRLELTNRKFVSNDLVRAVIERIIAPLGRRIDESSPMVDARLPDGSRVNAIIPPLSLKGPALSIRKFARTRYSGEDLIAFGSLTPEMLEFIRASVVAKKNIVISGGTGSGKTTFLNVISTSIPETERIVTIEDAAELQLSQSHWLNLESRPTNVEGKGEITIRDLFRNALRMRPDRIIVGECRGDETLDMLQAMNTGHQGSLTTVHANSPRDAVSRLDSMVLMSSVELPIRAIREMIASAINLVIHTARLSDGSRKVLAVSELVGLANDTEIHFEDIFTFRQTGTESNGTVVGEFVTTGKQPSYLHELQTKGLKIDESVFAPAVAPSVTRREPGSHKVAE